MRAFLPSSSLAMSLLLRIPSAVLLFALISPMASSAFHSNYERLHKLSVDEPSKGSASRILKSFIGDDGRVYACSGKYYYAFERNGSIAWRVFLNYTCNSNIAPVNGGSSKIYLVAENRVLKLYPLNVRTPEPVVEEFFGPAQGKEGQGEIIGLSASISSSCVLITVKNRGLFAYRLHGKLIWSAGTVLYQHGYRQGCRKNITECYFTSAPVIDQCEASIFILNNAGELYSLSVHGPDFKWIHDLSSFGNTLTITPGNNGLLYVTVPEPALVLALNVSTGNILWQGSFGPLSSTDYEPVVNANGWISFGSLDGYLYSFSPTGELKKFPRSPSLDSVIQVNPVVDCSGYALYISETEMEGKNSQITAEYTYVSALKPKNVVFTLLGPDTGYIYWSESDPSKFLSELSQSDLQRFVLDERTLLTFFAASRIGNPLPCHSTHQRLASSCSQVKPKIATIYTGSERTIIMILTIESVVLVLLTGAIRFCCVFWKKKKLQDQNLGKFLLRRRSLQSQEKAFNQMITEMEQKASEEAAANEVQETLSDLVRERQDIRRRLSTTYSLGRDVDRSCPASLLPRTQSYSFHGLRKGSGSTYHTISSNSSSETYSSTPTKDHHQSYVSEDEDTIFASAKAKGKAPLEVQNSGSEQIHGKRFFSISPSASGGSVNNSLSNQHCSVREMEEVTGKEDDEEEEESDDGGIMGSRHSKGKRLRRRTMSMSIS